jgi:hypothetical protein
LIQPFVNWWQLGHYGGWESRKPRCSRSPEKEVERASSKRRPILALRTDAAPLTPALEYFLSESQWVDATAVGTEAALLKVGDSVARVKEPLLKDLRPDPRFQKLLHQMHLD